MAGDWIKVEKSTPRKPEVMAIADDLGIHIDHAFGLCFRFWCWCDDQMTDGHALSVTNVTLDSSFGHAGFATALVKVGWLRVRNGSLEVPNFDRHLSESAKNRALSGMRKAKQRAESVTKMSRSERDKSVTREEKRREEIGRQYARAAGVPPDEAAGGRPEPRTVKNPGDGPAAGPGAPGNHAAVPGRGRMAAEPGAGNTRRTGEDDWRRPGWVHDEWARIVAAWNSTDRAVPWTLATPPNGFADLAACPGWVETALAAVAMLPDCRRFSRPVPWTQFVRDLDRIIAGEFRDPATERRELAAAGGRQQKRGNMR
jgi:hypothetical protein